MKGSLLLLFLAAISTVAKPSNSAIISAGVVGADDQPVTGAINHLWSEPTLRVRSGADGHFEIVLDSASFRYSELLARSEDSTLQGTWFNADADQQTVKQRETGRITVRPSVPLDITVKDSHGNPLPQAEVGLETYPGRRPCSRWSDGDEKSRLDPAPLLETTLYTRNRWSSAMGSPSSESDRNPTLVEPFRIAAHSLGCQP